MNYTSRYVRLFPVDIKPLNDDEITNIINLINCVSSCYYFWDTHGNYLDILYTSKYPIKYFVSDEVLDKFHYWEIGADEGYSHDTIMGVSKLYKTSKLGNKFNYSSTCYYQINQIRFTGFDNSFEDYIKQVLYKEYGSPIISENGVYTKYEKIIYTATNDRWCIIDTLENNKNLNFENEMFDEGFILTSLSTDTFQDDTNAFETVLKNTAQLKISKVKCIELMFDEKITHKFDWDIKTSRWVNQTGDFWSNCIDSEYIRFEEWYRNEKKIANKG